MRRWACLCALTAATVLAPVPRMHVMAYGLASGLDVLGQRTKAPARAAGPPCRLHDAAISR